MSEAPDEPTMRELGEQFGQKLIAPLVAELDALRAEIAEARARIEGVTKGIDAAIGALSRGTGLDHLGAISILRWEKSALAKEQPR
jgi:hypothetical protein